MYQERWSSNTGFILATVGAAVGIGNIWRFPYIVGTHGGGAFLIPYFIAVLGFGLPLMMLEFAIARRVSSSLPQIFETFRPWLMPVGWALVFVVLVILSYYLVVTGWVLSFFVIQAGRLDTTFEEYIGSHWPIVGYIVSVGLTLSVVVRGVKEGIERLNRMLVPALAVMVIGLAVYALSQPGAGRGVSYYLSPDYRALAKPEVWLAAFGQSFFSLSVGTGILLVYGGYGFTGTVRKVAVVVTLADLAVALAGGFVIFPLVFSAGLDPAMGPKLAFEVLPNAFDRMPAGALVGSVFFLMLFVAALTSAVSILEVPVSAVMARWKLPRSRAAWLCALVVMVIGLPSALSYSATNLRIGGVVVLDWKDFTFGTVGLILGALVTCIAGAWLAPRADLEDAAGGARLNRHAFVFLLRWIVPVVLLAALCLKVADGK